MIDVRLLALLTRGEELFVLLEQETSTCLNTLEIISVDDVAHFLLKRQKIVSELADFDTKLLALQNKSQFLVHLPDQVAIQEFNYNFSRVLQRIIRMEGLLVALAERKMISLRNEMDSLSRGLKALSGYQSGHSVSSLRDFIA